MINLFENKDLKLEVRTLLNEDVSISINLEDVARGLGFTQTQEKNEKTYTSIRWERVKAYLQEFDFHPQMGERSSQMV